MIAMITIVVKDYDDAIAYYTDILSFELIEDTRVCEERRWVVLAPDGADDQGARILLARAANDEQRFIVGNQAGGRVFMFLYTADFDHTYNEYKAKGVRFCETPRHEPYGKVVVFKDLYGNKWDLIEPKMTGVF